jgi:hypothetical protein
MSSVATRDAAGIRNGGQSFLISSILVALVALGLVVTLQPGAGTQAPVVLVIALVAVMSGNFAILVAGGRVRALDLMAVYIYIHVTLFVLRPWWSAASQDGLNLFTKSGFGNLEVRAAVIAGVGYVALALGYAWSGPKVRRDGIGGLSPAARLEAIRQSASRVDSAVPWLVATVLGGLLLYSFYVVSVGVEKYFSQALSGRTEDYSSSFESSSGYFYTGVQVATGTLVLLALHAYLRRRFGSALVYVIAIIALSLPTIAAGSRATFLPVIVAALILINEVKPGFLRRPAVVVVAPIVAFLAVIAPRVWRDQLASGTSWFDAVGQSLKPENALQGFLGGNDTAMFDAFALQVGAQGSGSLPLLWGKTYASSVGAFVPRGLWPTKPESVDEYLNSVIFPETHARGIGFSFGIYSEPYLNFGIAGVVAVLLIFGLFLGWIQRRAIVQADIATLYVVAMIGGFLFPIVRGSISFDIQRALIAMLPALIALTAWRFVGRGPSSRTHRRGASSARRRARTPTTTSSLKRSDG